MSRQPVMPPPDGAPRGAGTDTPLPAPVPSGTGTPDLNDLFYFARVVDEGGFSAAARKLGLSKSHLSRRVAALEARLGLRLLQRSTRRLILTEAGERYLAYCRTIAQTAHEADQSMLGLLAEPTGRVTISSPIALAQAVLPPLMPEFLRRYPKVSVRLQLVTRVVDLYREPVDIALRVRDRLDEDAGLVVRRFGTSALTLVASRAYLERCGTPTTPEELCRHTTVSFDVNDDGPHEWRLYDENGKCVVVQHQPRLLCGDVQLLIETVRQGHGIGLLPDTLWRGADVDGNLVQLLPDWRLPEGIVYAAYASRRGMTPAVRALLDFLSEHLTALFEAEGPFSYYFGQAALHPVQRG